MDDDEINLTFGQSYINIYLPQDPEPNVPHRNVPPPSPDLFQDDGVYKLSEEVTKDRHMFFGRKLFYQHKFPTMPDDKPRSSNVNNASNGDSTGNRNNDNNHGSNNHGHSDHVTVNVVKLNFDASSQRRNPKIKFRNGSRFNERLSAYVTTRKKIQVVNKAERMESVSPRNPLTPVTPRAGASRRSRRNDICTNTDSDAKTIRSGHKVIPPAPNGTPAPTPAPTTAQSSRGRSSRRTISFALGDASPAPSGLSSYSSILRHSVTPGKEGSRSEFLLFPEYSSTSLLTRNMSRHSQYGKLPSRPSSKGPQIWRPPTDLLVSRKTPSIEDLGPDKVFPRQPVIV